MTATALLTEAQRAEVRRLIEHLLQVLVPTPEQLHHIPQSPQYTVALTAGGKISQAGTVDPVTGGVARLIYVAGHIWQLAPPYGWYQKSEAEAGTAWAHDPTGPVSADGTKVSDPHDGIIDSKGYVAQRTHDGKIAIDGTVDPVTHNVKLLQYSHKQIWQETEGGAWYFTTLPSSAWAYSATVRSHGSGHPSRGSLGLGWRLQLDHA
jgi:hypothetical protein